jgi:tRNA1Val (adenine37-N6)-methyltransferase
VKAFNFNRTYDLIISNPPFYENNLLPESGAKAAAMHDATLRLDELLVAIKKCLAPKGHVALLIPYHRFDYFKTLSQSNGFYLQQAVHVRHSANRAAIRSMVLLSRSPAELNTQTITIKENSGDYTAGFKQLLNEYYL